MTDPDGTPIEVVHLYSGDDGQSHFRDLRLRLDPVRRGLGVELIAPVEGMLIRELPSGFTLGYHNAPRRQIVLQLSGQGRITCGDGSTRVFGPGDILLADDRTGQGHLSDEVSGPRHQFVVYLDPELDLETLGVGQ